MSQAGGGSVGAGQAKASHLTRLGSAELDPSGQSLFKSAVLRHFGLGSRLAKQTGSSRRVDLHPIAATAEAALVADRLLHRRRLWLIF